MSEKKEFIPGGLEKLNIPVYGKANINDLVWKYDPGYPVKICAENNYINRQEGKITKAGYFQLATSNYAPCYYVESNNPDFVGWYGESEINFGCLRAGRRFQSGNAEKVVITKE